MYALQGALVSILSLQERSLPLAKGFPRTENIPSIRLGLSEGRCYLVGAPCAHPPN